MRQVVLVALLAMAAIVPAQDAFAAGKPSAVDRRVPRYTNIFVVVDENKDFWRVDGGVYAPTMTRFARTYGRASKFYGEVHPSEANYVALLGGSTYGIADDDAYFCLPHMKSIFCPNAFAKGYPRHLIDKPSLASQLTRAGLSWKGYFQSIPVSGSLAVVGASETRPGTGTPHYYDYASKHSGFLNFRDVVNDPNRARHLVGFAALNTDFARNRAPNFALIVPNLCDDMHGMLGPSVPADCRYGNERGLIRRGDAAFGRIALTIMSSRLWNSAKNVAIVLTFDEDDGSGMEGCCGVTPHAPSNFGGGHIATIVITNHGARHVVDATPYNHYSLLRTIEDAFGIYDYLAVAARTDLGVRPMVRLFARDRR